MSQWENLKKSMSGLRTAYYPPLTDVTIKPDQMRCGEHFDWGTISLIISDSPGLEVGKFTLIA